MAKYIELEVAVKAFNNFDAGRADSPPCTLLTPEEFAEYLYELPTADVAPVVHGREKWVPVTERLPEVWRNDETSELVNYMIYSPDFGVDIGNYHAKAKKWFCMALPCTVTHWRPLPDGPEVE